jgi:chromosome segregation ATPase
MVSVGCVTAVLAQGKSDPADSSLAALTSEVRQLRLAVEELSKSQTQTQALGVYLSVQQSRIVQVANRLDAAQRDLDAAAARSREMEGRVMTITDELQRISDPRTRAELEGAAREFKAEQRLVDLQWQQARSRESELSQALQLEESRWTDLIARLEKLVAK